MARFRYVGPRTLRGDGSGMVGVRYRGRIFEERAGVLRLKGPGDPPHPTDTDEPRARRGGAGGQGATIIDVGMDAMAAAAFRNARGLGGAILYREIP